MENEMATKNIARSALEGGRNGWNKWERRYSHNEERTEVRDFLKKVAIDPEYAEEELCEEIRPIGKEFTDKLNPMYRWLKKQVGRLWADVRSEIFEMFDTRTTAGRHITFDHLLKEIVDTQSGFDKHGNMANPNIMVEHIVKSKYYYKIYSSYYVDENGILCGIKARPKRKYEIIKEEDCLLASKFLSGNMVCEKGGKLYWFAPSEGIWFASWIEPHNIYDRFTRNELRYYLREIGSYQREYKDILLNYKVNDGGPHWEYIENPFSFRQRSELSAEQVKAFKSLKKTLQEDILRFGKGR